MKIHVDGVDREMTDIEQTDYLTWQLEKQAKMANNEKVAADKQALKLATLAKLGLTADEVAALLS